MVLPVPIIEWGVLVFRNFFSLTVPFQRYRSCPNSFVYFFFLFILEISLPFWKSEVFYQHSVGIVPYVDIFCCICVVKGDHHDSSAILKVPSGIVSLISISDLSLLLYESESEVTQSCPTLCDPMDCSLPGSSQSITNCWSLPKPMSTESVMPSNHLILCNPLLFLPSIFPSIRVFSNESALPIRWPKYWSFSFNISPSKEHPGLISFRID